MASFINAPDEATISYRTLTKGKMMHITFVSNYINHHQVPLCEEFYRLTGANFTFLQTEPMTEERIKMGWDPELIKKPYVMQFSDNPDAAKTLIFEDDCVIFGGTESQELIIPRLEDGKFTIRYSERLYKTGRWKFISPRGIKQKRFDHTRFKYSPVYMLCAGAYVAGDFKLVGAYPGKKLKFGYFPKFYEYEELHAARKNKEITKILWAARFIDWKHPEVMTELAEKIKRIDGASSIDKSENNIKSIHITMVGGGELLEKTKDDVDKLGLSDYISFAGSKTPDEVRQLMLESNIFISTSDRQEGWGAVVNEAMNSGCVTIAAKDIGAAPWLIKDGENGYLYKACNTDELLKKVLMAASDKEKSALMGTKAYESIKNIWNARVAAERLYEFILDEKHLMPEYREGPLSRA